MSLVYILKYGEANTKFIMVQMLFLKMLEVETLRMSPLVFGYFLLPWRWRRWSHIVFRGSPAPLPKQTSPGSWGSHCRGCENSPAARELPWVDIIGNQRWEFAEKGNGAILAVSLYLLLWVVSCTWHFQLKKPVFVGRRLDPCVF